MTMKKMLYMVLLLCVPLSAGAQVARYVNPMIGTTGMGHCFPGACAPFGAVQLSPDTDTIPHNVAGKYQPRAYDYCAGYQYTDNTMALQICICKQKKISRNHLPYGSG